MKTFKAILLVKTAKGFLAVKQDIPELWITPEDEFQYFSTYDIDYKLRDMIDDEHAKEDDNATK